MGEKGLFAEDRCDASGVARTDSERAARGLTLLRRSAALEPAAVCCHKLPGTKGLGAAAGPGGVGLQDISPRYPALFLALFLGYFAFDLAFVCVMHKRSDEPRGAASLQSANAASGHSSANRGRLEGLRVA